MGAKNNPFYVEPATMDVAPVMAGLNSVIDRTRQNNYRQRMKGSMMDAFNSGDPAKVAEFVAEYPEAQSGMSAALGFKNESTKKNYMSTLRDVLTTSDLYGDNTAERDSKIVGMLEARNEYVKKQGGTPVDTEEAITNFKADPEGFIQRAQLGYAGMAPKEEWEAYKSMQAGGDVDPKFLEEERKSASQDVRAFNTKTRDLRTSYGQLQGLAEQARSGDRGARNAMTVTLSRLISPGIVTEAEARGLSGGQEIMQYVLQKVSTGDANTDNLLKSLDPYGEGFDADAMLKIGESVVASGKKPLIDMYEGSMKRAERAKMSNTAFTTNFGDNENYNFLLQMGQNGGGGTTPTQAGQPAGAPAPAAPSWPTQYTQGQGTAGRAPNPAQLKLLSDRPELAPLFLEKYGYLPAGVGKQGGM